jgi:hypothetical protein
VQRLQALSTMHELLVTLADSPIRKHIVIEPNPANTAKTDEHIIKIKTLLDDDTTKTIEPIIQKYNLKIEKMPDAVIFR